MLKLETANRVQQERSRSEGRKGVSEWRKLRETVENEFNCPLRKCDDDLEFLKAHPGQKYASGAPLNRGCAFAAFPSMMSAPRVASALKKDGVWRELVEAYKELVGTAGGSGVQCLQDWHVVVGECAAEMSTNRLRCAHQSRLLSQLQHAAGEPWASLIPKQPPSLRCEMPNMRVENGHGVGLVLSLRGPRPWPWCIPSQSACYSHSSWLKGGGLS
jgi:hypothetical protein